MSVGIISTLSVQLLCLTEVIQRTFYSASILYIENVYNELISNSYTGKVSVYYIMFTHLFSNYITVKPHTRACPLTPIYYS